MLDVILVAFLVVLVASVWGLAAWSAKETDSGRKDQ
ncbi:signal peptide protein [Paenibacillus sp. NPDC057967]